MFINLSHSLDGKPLLGASSDLVSVRRGPGDCLGFVLPPAQLELGQHSPKNTVPTVLPGGWVEKFLARQEFGNLWTLRDPQPSDSSIYLYLTLEVFQTYDNKSFYRKAGQLVVAQASTFRWVLQCQGR